jgi:hypothetical protein
MCHSVDVFTSMYGPASVFAPSGFRVVVVLIRSVPRMRATGMRVSRSRSGGVVVCFVLERHK